MRRILVIALLALSGGAAAGSRLAAQGDPTVDQILDKYVAAIGGRAAVEKVTSVSAHGRIDVPDANLTGTVERLQKAPDKALTRIAFDGVGEQLEGFDGSVGWATDFQGASRVKT